MMEYLIIAWRNIWRNKRRTLITAASVFFAVFFAIMVRGFTLGEWNHIIDGVLHSYSGYIQVHANGYWDDKTFDYSMESNDSLQKMLSSIPKVTHVIPRIESFALASTGTKTKGVIVTGIDPEKENGMTKLKSKIVGGSYLNMNDSAVMISQRLSEFLKISAGDTLILISQGYQGNSAATMLPVKGIVKLPSPEFDNKMVYMPIPVAQNFYSASDRITTIVVDIARAKDKDQVVKAIRKKVDLKKYEVLDWTQMIKELYQMFQVKSSSNNVILAILYIIVGFGVFGTVLMMTSERIREFGIMVAIGMQKKLLAMVVAIELICMVTMGLIAGMIGSFPIILYYHLHPIHLSGEAAQALSSYGMEPVIPVLWQSDYIVNQGIVVFILVLFAIIYPLWKISKLNVTKALKS